MFSSRLKTGAGELGSGFLELGPGALELEHLLVYDCAADSLTGEANGVTEG